MKIIVNNLTKSFDDVVLFKDLSFEIEEGLITCLYGKSGSGKTTLLNILGGIEKYDSGNIYYNGKEIKHDLRKYLKDDFGFIFQNFGLLENETVYDNFMIVKKIAKLKKGERDKKIKDILNMLDLKGMERNKAVTLSGGEQQRVAIAKIILKDPDLVLADEPTASLDAENKQKVIELLFYLKSLGKTIVIVSHDKEIIAIADKIIDINELGVKDKLKEG